MKERNASIRVSRDTINELNKIKALEMFRTQEEVILYLITKYNLNKKVK